MTNLHFTDGMTINTNVSMKIIKKQDGYYVVGNGMSIPVDSKEEGREIIKELAQGE